MVPGHRRLEARAAGQPQRPAGLAGRPTWTIVNLTALRTSPLSHYLREVRQGRSFTVLSHDIPVATLGPCGPADLDDLEVIEPEEDTALWGQVEGPPLDRVIDVVALIRDDRDDRDDRLEAIVKEALEQRQRAREGHGMEGDESA